MPTPLEIVYQDDRYIAIDKPAGMLVHRSDIAADDDSPVALQTLRDQIGSPVYPAHRIDRPTSGLLMFALDNEAMVALKKLFEACEISKTYWAIVRGHAPEKGLIEKPLRKLNDFKGPKKHEETQEAETRFVTLSQSELPYPTERYETSRFSLVQLHPKTGRRHQLRRHLDDINHPIVGDTRHGDNKLNKRFRENFGFLRLMLAATQLEFDHPFTNERVCITCPVARDFQKALEITELAKKPLLQKK